MKEDFIYTKAIVEFFGVKKRCWVKAFGKPKKEYTKKNSLFVERPEDEYAALALKAPFCMVERRQWLKGSEV